LEAILLAIVQDRAHRDDERVLAERSYPVRQVCVIGLAKAPDQTSRRRARLNAVKRFGGAGLVG
jgi:hypothetical protein